jgi:enamine deaminase RidA (YjgF/YER057c/UK114 family)
MNHLFRSITLLVTTLAASATFALVPESDAIKRGNIVYISGQGGGNIDQPDNNGAAIEESILAIKKIAEENGGSLDNIVKLDVYLSNLPKDFDALNAVEAKYFHKPFPTRTTVGAVIPKNHTVEINAIMVLPQ